MIYLVVTIKETDRTLESHGTFMTGPDTTKMETKYANDLLEAIEKYSTTGRGKETGIFVRNKLKNRHSDDCST